MDLSKLTNPTVLIDWVGEHARSEMDFLQFCELMHAFFDLAVKEYPNSPLRLAVNSGTMNLEDGSKIAAYFADFLVQDDKNESWNFRFAIEIDSETGKLGVTRYIKQDTPVLTSTRLH